MEKIGNFRSQNTGLKNSKLTKKVTSQIKKKWKQDLKPWTSRIMVEVLIPCITQKKKKERQWAFWKEYENHPSKIKTAYFC